MTTFSFEPLTPTAFLDRSAYVYPDRPALLDGDRRFTYGELRERARRVAGGLAGLGVDRGDRVAVLAPNSYTLLEAHNAVPYAGAVAVVARPDEKWGEVPIAFVAPKPGRELSEDTIVDYVKQRIAHYKAPKAVHFGPLPKTSTGKVRKHELRERASASEPLGGDLRERASASEPVGGDLPETAQSQ